MKYIIFIILFCFACEDDINKYYVTEETTIEKYFYTDAGIQDPIGHTGINDTDFETPPVGCEGIVIFPDKYLEKYIRLNIGKPAGDLYYEDLLAISKVEVAGLVTNFTNIHCLGKLTKLYFVIEEINIDIINIESIKQAKTIMMIEIDSNDNINIDLSFLLDFPYLWRAYVPDNLCSSSVMYELNQRGIMTNCE